MLQGEKGDRGPPGIDGPPGRQGFPGMEVKHCSYREEFDRLDVFLHAPV